MQIAVHSIFLSLWTWGFLGHVKYTDLIRAEPSTVAAPVRDNFSAKDYLLFKVN